MEDFAAVGDAVNRELGAVRAQIDATRSGFPRAQGVPLIRHSRGGDDDALVCIPLAQLRSTD
eukprot:6626409-Lingulodinium_polyedra.AAC.1